MHSRYLMAFGIAVLVLLHHDFWWWGTVRLVAGVPIHLLYHVVFSLIVAGVLAFGVARFWPADLDDPRDEDR